MAHADLVVDVNGMNYVLAVLDEGERQLAEELKEFADREQDWAAFSNFYVSKIGAFYKSRGLSQDEIVKSPVWRFAQEIAGRIHIAQGRARQSDYRDELERLIQCRFRTRREFCEATGISEDMLSHVLAKRKDFGIHTLADALAKIGYTIHITKMPDAAAPLVETSDNLTEATP